MPAAVHAQPSAPPYRAVVILLSIALSATLLASLVNLWSATASQRRFDQLLRAPLTDADIRLAAVAGEQLAKREMRLQAVSLGTIVVALALTVGAVWLHYRRSPTLDRWVTVCAWTRQVYWQGHWISFEDYLAQRFDLRCTHGICDEEAVKLRRAR